MSAHEDREVVAGRYRLDQAIGSGGMGTVWAGYDLMLQRPVAVKEIGLPAQGVDRTEAIARAFAEARNAARLHHPNIVTVHDIVEHDGRPWIVMQLVDGVSLYQYVREHGPMRPAEAARVGLALVEALSAAHAADVIHRDVKPSNVLIQPDGRVLLTDFSIAYAVGSAAMTSSAILLGSPGYVAPERVGGERAGPPADLFGLGATLYFLVEGRGPFDNEDVVAGMLASYTRPHPRPANAGPLAEIIDALLEKDPQRRMSASAARAALADATRPTRPLPARQPGPPTFLSGPPSSVPPSSVPPSSGPPFAGPPVSGPPFVGPPSSGPPFAGPPGSVPHQTVPPGPPPTVPPRGRPRRQVWLIVGGAVLAVLVICCGLLAVLQRLGGNNAAANPPGHPDASATPSAGDVSAAVSGEPSEPVDPGTASLSPSSAPGGSINSVALLSHTWQGISGDDCTTGHVLWVALEVRSREPNTAIDYRISENHRPAGLPDWAGWAVVTTQAATTGPGGLYATSVLIPLDMPSDYAEVDIKAEARVHQPSPGPWERNTHLTIGECV